MWIGIMIQLRIVRVPDPDQERRIRNFNSGSGSVPKFQIHENPHTQHWAPNSKYFLNNPYQKRFKFNKHWTQKLSFTCILKLVLTKCTAYKSEISLLIPGDPHSVYVILPLYRPSDRWDLLCRHASSSPHTRAKGWWRGWHRWSSLSSNLYKNYS